MPGKVPLVILAIFSGWLFSEIKEFIVHGGHDNKLAVSLLKITFIFNMMMLSIFWDAISQKYLFKNEPKQDPPTNCADSSDSCIIERSTAKSSTALRRSLSKSRRNRFENDLNMNSD